MQYAESITLTSPDICHDLLALVHHLILHLSPLPWLLQSTKAVSATDGQIHVHKEGCLKMRNNQKRKSGSLLRNYFQGWMGSEFSLHWQTPYIYTGCPRRNVPEFGRAFLMLKYTDITQNTYVQSWTVTEIMAREKCGLHRCRRTVCRPWRHTCPMCLPENETW